MLATLLDDLAEEAAAPPVARPGSAWYRETYLVSDHWAATRLRAIAAEYGRCCDCKARGGRLDVHHLSYERLWREHPSDLVPLCRRCHDLRHSRPPVRPTRRSRKSARKRDPAMTALVVASILTAGLAFIAFVALLSFATLVRGVVAVAGAVLRPATVALFRRPLTRRWERRKECVLTQRWGFAYAAGNGIAETASPDCPRVSCSTRMSGSDDPRLTIRR